jgi:DNA-directed RNA polymerase specialized sigma24 family protein
LESDLAWAPTHTLTNPFTEVVDHSAANSILAAVLDLLSAIRCRLRRQLFRSKDLDGRSVPLGPELSDAVASRSETGLEELARLLIELRREGMRADEVKVLYAHHVLGYSMSELSALTGRDRRALYTRRDRGQRRLCA